ncbi:MAG: 1-acyl-sn-glycerol-3-phosphate acyltransferase, partial [Moraxellaceae bacterium]|nr:1-acyl-sn-glycerol-3-phosphate acyltransferase [Moraxellaceae bacterium]
DGNISEKATYSGNMTMKDSLKNVMDSNDITAHIMPLEPIFPEDKSQDELTEILAERMQTGLTKLQKQVLKNKPKEAIW